MRHLNEIVRERNQYSRDAMEAWQDFINLKGRMDTELAKVSKRNNFLNEELESWKAQFLKFQAFAEQLTKETNDLKHKIENYRRESRRLTSLAEQNRDEMQRLNTRLSGTEKQRDDALEALVLQQDIAEEIDRDRKRIKKELASLQGNNSNLSRQRDEAHRVVLHLRALIDGQAHHMEHIVKQINNAPEMQGEQSKEAEEEKPATGLRSIFNSNPSAAPTASPKRQSMNDVADRYLREKTDSISYIIRNISEQCAKAISDLQMANRTDTVDSLVEENPDLAAGSVDGEEGSINTARDSIPPTPDLVHHNRSSTSMSVTTDGTYRDTESVTNSDAPVQVLNSEDSIKFVEHPISDEPKRPINAAQDRADEFSMA